MNRIWKKVLAAAGMAAGIGILFWGSIELPGKVFSMQDGMREQEMVLSDLKPIELALSENPEKIPLTLEEKMKIVNETGLVMAYVEVRPDKDKLENSYDSFPAVILENIQDFIQWGNGPLKVKGEYTVNDGDTQEAISSAVTWQARPVLFCDSEELKRQFWVWNFSIIIDGWQWDGWLDDKTGKIVGIFGGQNSETGYDFLKKYYDSQGLLDMTE
ncbi:hypothetical protein [Cuneatibacter caecimuris]|uniref:Uncharacterized protein n=1 Tax=Cuneatibacter caecimuris TaxID=1796618 RepID=A0A4Q7PKN6_9FIRM|nr:hypothetical protein [Cuneatibacter caecimuris]RZT00421.1 hypothetical protein EV209_1730 [Cuneatibacter caecimuris]